MSARPSVSRQELYRSTLQEAAAGGAVLMGKLVAAARLALQSQEAEVRDLQERDALIESASLLRSCEAILCQGFAQALLQAFANPPGPQATNTRPRVDLHFDQLELMDDAQVQATVNRARVQQVATLATEIELAELNTLMGSLLGMHSVRAELNPLRPEAFVNALQAVLAQTQAAPRIQWQWLNAMSATLGQELSALYVQVSARLRLAGVVAVSYALASKGPLGALSGRPPGEKQALLTLDRLHGLLSGALVAQQDGQRVDQFAAQFSQQFDDSRSPAEGPASDFANTVPAALEALHEMQQVERVVQSLEQRRQAGAAQPGLSQDSVEGQRLLLRRGARDIAQALSLEVVTLMVENMAQDVRLLEPVRQLIRRLEPALLRLALVDQRFFTDKQHPARRLLQELTHRSMAFESLSARGFDDFVQGLQRTLSPLFSAPIESAEVFEQQLGRLQQHWSDDARPTEKGRDAAVQALQHAEARNLLAEGIAKGIENHPDAASVPTVVIDFLCGPWAQVLAQVRITQGVGSAADEKFGALIPALLWSAHPELARGNPAQLTRLLPRLLATPREGLDTIHYPGTGTSVFLEALMAIHQKAFHAAQATPAPEVQTRLPQAAARPRPVADGNPWLGPQEALASNFMELPESVLPLHPQLAPDLLSWEVAASDVELPLGTWVELWLKDQWVRTQLTWASPHGTLYLFTGAFGTTQSISRRMRDKMLAQGKLRLISGRPLDEGALDAVAQAAMRNSLDRLP